MRVIQIAHALTEYDAASRFVLHMDEILREIGYETAIFAQKIDARLASCGILPMRDFDGTADDIVIYHMTTGTSFNKWVARYPHKIALYYHNITPAKFFFGNAWGSWWKCIRGRRQLKDIVKNTFFAWGASAYSCEELRALGIQETKPLPIIVETEALLQRPRVLDVAPCADGRKTILYVGRGVPHKKQDEAIEAMRAYRDLYGKAPRLVIIGNMKPSYGKKLHRMVESYRLTDDVIFAGSVSDDALCSWYRTADALLCLSEHEGFCVPLVEAMAFDKPVFAYAAAAVPETVGDAGVLLREKTPQNIATVLHDTLYDEAKLAALREARVERLAALSRARIKTQIESDMAHIVSLWRTRRA